MLARRLLLLLLALYLTPLSAAADEALDASRRNLEEIQGRIRQAAKSLEEKKAAERSLAADLQTVESEIESLGSRVAGKSRRLAALEQEIAAKNVAIGEKRLSIAALEAQVRRRLVALYKGGEVGFVRVLFSSVSPAAMAEDHDFLGRIVRRDRELLATYRRQLQELEEAQRQLAALSEEQRKILAALQADRLALREAARLKEQLLQQVRNDRQSLAEMLRELREKAERLAELVKRLESEKSREYTEKSAFFTARKGRLPWPAEGAVRIGFGPRRHPELGTLVDSQGVEIAVAGEQPIRAVSPGRVIFANWFKGYGNLLILDHGESYYSLYAQAARLTKKVGEQVAEGEVLAFSGLEGSSGVYFEIRHRGTPLDPAAWLRPR